MSAGKSDGQGWHFVQDLRAIDKTALPCFLVVPNPNTVSLPGPPDSDWFTSGTFVQLSCRPPTVNIYLLLLRTIDNIPGQSGLKVL